MKNEISYEKTETFFFDETGTPADLKLDGLFVVGGFAIHGDLKPVLKEWNTFLDREKLHGKKGRKYSPSQFLDVAEILCKNKIIPLTSYSYINADDVDHLEKKLEEYEKKAHRLDSTRLKIKKATYMWSMHVAITVVTSIFSLAFHRGPIERIMISVDKYLSNPDLQKIIQNIITNSFAPKSVDEFLRPFINQHERYPDMKKFLSNWKLVKREFFTLDLNMSFRDKCRKKPYYPFNSVIYISDACKTPLSSIR